ERATGGRVRPSAQRVVFDDGVEVVVPGAVRADCGALLRTVLRHPAGTGASLLAPEPLCADHAAAVVHAVVAREPRLVWRLAPNVPGLERTLAAPGPAVVDADVTQVLDLTEGDPLGRPSARRARRAAAAAERRGIRVERAARPEAWAEYVALYRTSLGRWGERSTSACPPALFDALAALAREPGSDVELWL